VKVIEAEDGEDLARKAKHIVIGQLRTKTQSVIVFPTGNTPVPMFKELASEVQRDPNLFRHAHLVTLDEYADIPQADRRRLLSWLDRELLEPAGLRAEQVLAFNPAENHASECARMEEFIASLGGLDLAVLGLGPNGHLGFNEPGSPFDSRARKVALAPESIASNAPYWGNEADVPLYGLTLGLGTLREARTILLLASGAAKSDIVARLMHEPISEALPATLLRLCPQSILLADRAALSKAEHRF
jgi:glucosamine-6-phosphate deaminase